MDTVIHVFVIYVFLLIGFRLLGKREFSQMAPMEFVILLMIPEIVTQALNREDHSLTGAIIGVTTLFALVFISSTLVHLSERADKVMQGIPCVIVKDGKFITENMNKERITPDEVSHELHKNGLERLDQVKWAILETDGSITIIPKEQ